MRLALRQISISRVSATEKLSSRAVFRTFAPCDFAQKMSDFGIIIYAFFDHFPCWDFGGFWICYTQHTDESKTVEMVSVAICGR